MDYCSYALPSLQDSCKLRSCKVISFNNMHALHAVNLKSFDGTYNNAQTKYTPQSLHCCTYFDFTVMLTALAELSSCHCMSLTMQCIHPTSLLQNCLHCMLYSHPSMQNKQDVLSKHNTRTIQCMSYFNFVATIPFHIGEHVNCIHVVTTTSHFLSSTFHILLSLSAM